MGAVSEKSAITGPAVSVGGLVKRYGEVLAVDGLDLEVRPGECFGLLGPNGAGKTTAASFRPRDSGPGRLPRG